MNRSEDVIKWLEQIKGSNGVMSDLRRSLVDETAHRAWAHISSLCSLMNTRDELVTRTVCGLYAKHPQHSEKTGNIGESIHMLAVRRGDHDLKTHERYLKRLVRNLSRDDVCAALPHIVAMLKAEGVPVNYKTLYEDLYYWSDRSRIGWCKTYYAGKEDADVSDTGKDTSD